MTDNDGLLQQIAGEVNRRLNRFGFSQDKKFHSHVTLARIKTPLKISDVEKIKNIKGNFYCDVKSFELMASTLKPSGSEYKVIKSFPLK
jgi:2'-5' RNA ligase